MKMTKNKKYNYFLISILLLMLVKGFSGYTQNELHTPYPIIFVHGLNSNYKTWYGKPGTFDNVIDYLTGGATPLKDGGQINVSLDYDRSTTSLSNTKEDDVHLFTTNPAFGDFYTINFDVSATGLDLSGFHGWLIATNQVTSVSISKTETNIGVTIPAQFFVGDIITIGKEYMKVTGIGEKIISVERHILGSQAENHYLSDFVYNISGESNQASIVKQGYGLKLAIDAVKLKTKASKVILVGHSMGGLAIREYLRSYYNDDVAKVVTIGTPHLGSNASEISSLGDNIKGIDYRSDAVRDLMYNYSGIDGNPQPPYGNSPDNSIYLFGGDSELFLASETNFYNPDVNANGIIDNNIQPGLNTDIPKTLPTSVSYSWIISQWVPNGDGLVLYLRQFPWFEYGPSGSIKTIGNIIKTNKFHTDEPKDYYSLLRGLDEPNNQSLAYEIGQNSVNKGFITFQTAIVAYDLDYFKIIPSKKGTLTISFSDISNTLNKFELLDEKQNSLGIVENANVGQISAEVEANKNYFIRIIGEPNDGDYPTYENPYTLTSQFTPTPPANIDFSTSSLQYYDVVLNSTKDKIITITNKGTTDTLITGASLSGTDANQYSISPAPPFTISPTASQDLTVTFNPTSIGLKNATLTITTNSTDVPTKTITLAGNGVNHQTVVLSSIPSTSYTFDNTKIGLTRNKIVTLKNTGSSVCNISNITLEGLNPDNFSIVTQPTTPFDIATGTTKQIIIQFKPTSIGSKNVSLVIDNNSDNLSPKQTIQLYGNGLDNPYSGTNNIITNYEYWFDNQYNNKITTAVNSFGDFILDSKFNTDQLIIGLHSMHIRFKDNKGKWSSIVSKNFNKQPKGLRNIITSEYWFDNDYASKVLTSITPINSSILNTGLDANALTEGLHSFNLRYKDDGGKWSSIISKDFYKLQAGSSNITAYRYWVNNKFSDAVNVDVSIPSQIFNLDKDIDISNNIDGDYSINFQFKDSNGKWSSVLSKNFTLSTLSVVENTFKKNILVYPNPTNGVVFLDLGQTYNKVNIKLFDVRGRIVKERYLANAQKFSFNLNFPSGMYYMIITAENKKAIFKIIKY